MNRKKAYLSIFVIVTLFVAFAVLPKTAPESEPTQRNAQFVIAGWDFPDQYGQGIDAFYIYENSTGSWLLVGGYGPQLESDSNTQLNWTEGVGIKIRAECLVNSTTIGGVDITTGKNHLRHNVTVSTPTNSSIFSQNNFTYFSSAPVGDMYYYKHEVVLNFLPLMGETYTVIVTYEIYY